jgi:hypothetical protein
MTGLPIATPGGRPKSLAAFSQSVPTSSPALRYSPFCRNHEYIYWTAESALGRTHLSLNATHASEVVFTQVFQADFFQEVGLPTLHAAIDTYGHIALLADHRAVASLFVSGGNMGESISQIVKLAFVKHLLWHIILEPKGLGDLHLNGHLPADIAEEIVPRGIDLLRLLLYEPSVIILLLEVKKKHYLADDPTIK